MRILVIGASGSGTTTLGKAFSSENGWGFLDADDYYWLPTVPPFQEKRNHERRLEMILNDLDRHEDAVVSGSVMNWGLELEDSFDLIVFLYLDSDIRVKRLKYREEKRFGRADPEFLQWASEYDSSPAEGRSLTKHNDWLSERFCKIIRIEGNLSVNERIQMLTSALPGILP